MKDYVDKVVLVVGGTSGIGEATAVAFSEAGAKVVVTGRRDKEGKAVIAKIIGNGGTASFFHADVSKEEDTKAAVDFTVSTYGRLDAAFNNAGVESGEPIDQVTKEEFTRVFDINVWGVLNSMKHEIAAMRKSGGGAIVNNSSILGHVGFGGTSVYTASKHAVEGLTKAVALEVAAENIRVNAVAPGTIESEMVDRILEERPEAKDFLLKVHPVGRFGRGEEVAAAVLYLASDDARFTTGASLSVDGGWRAH